MKCVFSFKNRVTFIRYELSSVGLVGQRGSSGWKSISLPRNLQQDMGNKWPDVLFFCQGVPAKSVKLLTPQQDSLPWWVRRNDDNGYFGIEWLNESIVPASNSTMLSKHQLPVVYCNVPSMPSSCRIWFPFQPKVSTSKLIQLVEMNGQDFSGQWYATSCW